MADTAANANQPRFIKDPTSATVYDTAAGYLDPVLNPADLAKRSGQALGDFSGVATVPNAQGFLQDQFTRQATARYQPLIDQAGNSLSLGNAQIDQSVNDTNRQFDALGQTLAEAARAATGTMEEQQNNLGMLSSGLTQAGLGKIQSDLSKNTANSAQDRASTLAQLALQRAGLANTAASAKISAGQSITDMVSQLLSGSTAAQKAANALSPIDLGNKVVMVDPAGNIRQSFNKGLTPSASNGSSFASTGGTATDLAGDIQNAVSSGIIDPSGSAPGSREALITALASKYASSKTITPAEIATAVYSQIRGQNEGAFSGLSSDAQNFVNSLSGKGASTTEASKQVQTNIQVAQQALAQLQAASANLNTADTRASGAYAQQLARNNGAAFAGNNPDVVTMQSKGEAILTAIRALTNTGRITASELANVPLPGLNDTKAEAQTKIKNLQSLLDKAAGTHVDTSPSSQTSAISGLNQGLGAIWGF